VKNAIFLYSEELQDINKISEVACRKRSNRRGRKNRYDVFLLNGRTNVYEKGDGIDLSESNNVARIGIKSKNTQIMGT
jgi:hypothetical protein